MQLELIDHVESPVEQRMDAVEQKQSNVQRGLFKRYAELEKRVELLESSLNNQNITSRNKEEGYLF